MAVRLTSLAHGAGCACKIRPADLALVLRASAGLFPQVASGGIGMAVPDDAAVVPVPGAPAGTPSLVLTTDFFTPIVDDARTFGKIAAMNAISDVYAMGGTPRFALNLAAFPTKTLSLDILGAILAGGAEACAAEGVLVVGGHTIDDAEPKFGLAVIGTIDPDKVWRKRGARAGDALVITKAIGTGILATAFKRDAIAENEAGYLALVESTTTSNRRAKESAIDLEVHGATDVTGYGLLGHLLEMIGATQTAHSDSEASTIDVEIDARAVPFLTDVRRLAEAGFVPGGSSANLAFAAPSVDFGGVDELTRVMLADAQTSGGLLFALPPADARTLVDRFGAPAAIVGRVVSGNGRLRIRA